MTLPLHAGAASTISSGALGLDDKDESAETCLALLLGLEAALELSQSAVLGFDLKAIEYATAEQIRLGGELQTRWFDDLCFDDLGMVVAKPQVRASTLPCEQKLADEIQHAQVRVLHLTRVQAALLRRAQRSLSILTNVLARSYVSYQQNGSVTSIADGSDGGSEGSNLCRA